MRIANEPALIGIGLYTPQEAERLIHVPARKIARWLAGHAFSGKRYEPLGGRRSTWRTTASISASATSWSCAPRTASWPRV
jgi:hypothetical protein